MLPVVQVMGAEDFDFSVCSPQPEFNERSILWDLNYFKYCFLKSTGLDFQENRLEDDLPDSRIFYYVQKPTRLCIAIFRVVT